jgi:hypothetical protein
MLRAVFMGALCFCLSGWAGVSPAVSQEKPAESRAVDPRFQPLIGTWEGGIKFAKSKSDESRTLVVEEKGGQLLGHYGIPGKKLEPVVLTAEAVGSRIKVSFRTSAGNNINLELARDNWLTGVFSVSGSGRSGGSPDRQMDLERKK